MEDFMVTDTEELDVKITANQSRIAL